MNDDLIARIRLIRSPSIGPVTYRQLIARFGSAEAALDAIPDLARRGGGPPPKLFSTDDAERERKKVERLGARYLVLGKGLYPSLLAELDDAPPLLIAKGDIGLLDRSAIAIVGARNASAAACRFARSLAHDLGREGLVVVSGLARGIDSAAHDGALESGTIGVVAGGIDVVYPPENEAVRRRCSTAAWCSPKCRRGPSRGRATSRTATGSSPARLWGRSSSKPRRAPDR